MDLASQMAQLSYMVEHTKCTRNGVNLDCIYDNELLGFECSSVVSNDLCNRNKRLIVQDPLEEIDLGNGKEKRPTYISTLLSPEFKNELITILTEYKDCFAWEYDEMPGLNRDLVEHRLPLKPNVRPVKQAPRRFASEVLSKIKEEIERLLKAKFIRTARYVDWVSNIVLL